MKPTWTNPEMHNDFKVWHNNGQWIARRYHHPGLERLGIGEEYARKSKSSLVRFIKSKPVLLKKV